MIRFVRQFSSQYIFRARLPGWSGHVAFFANNPLDAHAKAWAWAAEEVEP